jgi:hypothetical protein
VWLAKVIKNTELFSASDREILKSPLASFFFLLTAVIKGSRVNQDALMRDDAIAVVGFLLQKVG